jgi:hypothetical protein
MSRSDESAGELNDRRHSGQVGVALARGSPSASEANAAQQVFNRVFNALDALGIHAEPAVYADKFADEVLEQLLRLDGVLVWVDPISGGRIGSPSMRCCGT